jgi:3-phenylpropionate/trans-cinnamate dioxygenase ferredoxin subunit
VDGVLSPADTTVARPACRLRDLAPGQAYRIPGDRPVAVFNVDGELLAVDDTCTHQDASLADGWLDGYLVECPLHASRFDLRTGRPDGPPAKTPLRTYPVSVEQGVVYVHPPT